MATGRNAVRIGSLGRDGLFVRFHRGASRRRRAMYCREHGCADFPVEGTTRDLTVLLSFAQVGHTCRPATSPELQAAGRLILLVRLPLDEIIPIPKLQVVEDAKEGDIATRFGQFHYRVGQEDPSLLVHRHPIDVGAACEHALELIGSGVDVVNLQVRVLAEDLRVVIPLGPHPGLPIVADLDDQDVRVLGRVKFSPDLGGDQQARFFINGQKIRAAELVSRFHGDQPVRAAFDGPKCNHNHDQSGMAFPNLVENSLCAKKCPAEECELDRARNESANHFPNNGEYIVSDVVDNLARERNR